MPALNVYQYRMPAGFAGDLQRAEAAVIEPQIIDPAAPPLSFGVPVKLVAGKIQPINSASDGVNSVYGVNLRPYPIQGNGTDPLGTSTPPASGVTDILKRGYVSVVLGGTTAAAKDGRVYVRTANPSSGKPLGGFEAAPEYAVTAGANTGNGTVGSISGGATPASGSYRISFTSATAFTVTAPDGASLPPGVVGTPYTNAQINFTITAGGTAFAANDSFTISQNLIVLPKRWYFTGPADAYGITELAVNY